MGNPLKVENDTSGVTKIDRGKQITEMFRGSFAHTTALIRNAFYEEFGEKDRDGYPTSDFWIADYFEDFVIASGSELGPSQYYQVDYTREGDEVSFADQADWGIVELTFEPANSAPAEEAAGEVPTDGLAEEAEEPVKDAVLEAAPDRYLGRGSKIREQVSFTVGLIEAVEGKPRVIRAVVAQADEINKNGRRYRDAVLQEAVADAQLNLRESLTQGRAILLGEAEHPADKRQKPRFLETIVKWTDVQYEGGEVFVDGEMIENSLGKDAIVTMEAGVLPGISLRGRGEIKTVREGKESVKEVQWIRFTGFDLVLNPSFEDAAVTVLETEQLDSTEENVMDPENVTESVAEVVDEQAMRDEIRAELEAEQTQAAVDAEQARVVAMEAELRESMGLEEGADISEAIEARNARLNELEAGRQLAEAADYIQEQLEDADYPENTMGHFTGLIGEPANIEEATAAFKNAKGLMDAFLADMKLQSRGFVSGNQIDVVGDVLEQERGVPSFAGPADEIAESLSRENGHMRRQLVDPRNVNERFTADYLKRYDEAYKHHLINEARQWAEAATTTPLNLPYTVVRAVVEEAFPELVAASLFDVQSVNASPMRLWYEVAFAAESGAAVTITDEEVTSSEDDWADLVGARVNYGSVVVTSDPAGTTFDEGDDYVIDHVEGRIKALSTGSITTSQALLIDYTYKAYRKGEGLGIERARTTLSYQTLDQAADRLATQITSEAIVFSRSQLGYDVVGGNITAMVKDLLRTIDGNLFANALSEVLAVSSNSGGTWTTASDALSVLEGYIGVAKVKIANRYYQPTGIVMSLTNSDVLSNSDRFTSAGARPDAQLDPAGYVGRIKGLPVFASTEFPDGYILVCNRQLVMHRVFQPLQLKGPIAVSDSNQKVVASEEYYAEEYNGTAVPVAGKGSTVKIA